LLALPARLEPEELEAMVQAVPKRHTIVGKVEGRWEVSQHSWGSLHVVVLPT
jgi:hypothetical protein